MHCSVSTVASTVSTVRTACLQELFRFLANKLFNLSGKTPDNYVTLRVQSRWLPPSASMMFVRSLIPSLSHVSYFHEPAEPILIGRLVETEFQSKILVLVPQPSSNCFDRLHTFRLSLGLNRSKLGPVRGYGPTENCSGMLTGDSTLQKQIHLCHLASCIKQLSTRLLDTSKQSRATTLARPLLSGTCVAPY